MTFVVFPLGGKRFALPATDVAELSHSGTMQSFPHATPEILGVLVRRGEILPIWDLAGTLLGEGESDLKYWMVTRRNSIAEESTAVPVSGECRMHHAEMQPAPQGAPAWVRGVLQLEDHPVDVLDLTRLSKDNL